MQGRAILALTTSKHLKALTLLSGADTSQPRQKGRIRTLVQAEGKRQVVAPEHEDALDSMATLEMEYHDQEGREVEELALTREVLEMQD